MTAEEEQRLKWEAITPSVHADPKLAINLESTMEHPKLILSADDLVLMGITVSRGPSPDRRRLQASGEQIAEMVKGLPIVTGDGPGIITSARWDAAAGELHMEASINPQSAIPNPQ